MRTCDYAIHEFDVAVTMDWYPRDENGDSTGEHRFERKEETVRILANRYSDEVAEAAVAERFKHYAKPDLKILARRKVELERMFLEP